MTLLDHKTAILVSEASDLLRSQERLLAGVMSEKDMMLYELRAQQIDELLRELTIDSDLRMHR
jgi:hypothetical protein